MVITCCVCICGCDAAANSSDELSHVSRRSVSTMSIDSTKSLLSTAMSVSTNAQQPAKAASARETELKVPAEKSVEQKAVKAAEVAKAAPTLEQVAARIDKYLKSVSRTLEFRVDAPGGHTVVSVRDTETGDLIRQFPNEEVLRLAEMAEDQTIVLVNEKV